MIKIGSKVKYIGSVIEELQGEIGTIVVEDATGYAHAVAVRFDNRPCPHRPSKVWHLNIDSLVEVGAFRDGDRVTYVGTLLTARIDKSGAIEGNRKNKHYSLVKFDGDKRSVAIDNSNLIPERKIPVNIKSFVATLVAGLLPATQPENGDSPREVKFNRLTREIGVANAIVSAGEARKKKAKADALEAGLILPEYKPGTEMVFDSKLYSLVAKTNEPGSRLDADALRKALADTDLSKAKQAKIFAAAFIETKPATSFIAEAK